MVKLEPLDQGRNNNFDLLRLIAAIMVILSHSYLVTGRFNNEPLAKAVGFLDMGSLGVKVFFAISGYLITKSITRQTINGFVWARALRIFPGLILTSIFCAFIIGPIATTLPLGQYFAAPALYNFMWKLSLLHNFDNALPGTFTFNHYPNAVNSPIWTLPAELFMYLMVLLGGVLIYIVKKSRKDILIIIITLLAVIWFFWGIAYSSTYLYYVFTWGRLFFLGGLCFLFRKRIVLSVPLLLGLVFVFCLIFHFKKPLIDYAFDVLLMYAILVFAYHPKLQIKGFHKIGDFSYGLYIYAFPIQQLIALMIPTVMPLTNFIYTIPLALALAVPSWYFVEKPLLALKTRKII